MAWRKAQARKLAAKPMAALVETKRLMKKGHMATVLAQMDEEGASFARLLQEPAAKGRFPRFWRNAAPDFSQL